MAMMKKGSYVGVAISPEMGLEVAQIDFETRTVLKYAVRPLEYNCTKREVVDRDIFKDSLQDIFDELEIPKNTEVAITIPNVFTKVNDYPAAMEKLEITGAIEDELTENYLFKETDACYSYAMLPSMSIQFNKVAYTAAQRSFIAEMVLYIKEMGYGIAGIDISTNSVLNSLLYLGRVNAEPDTNWLLVIVGAATCTVVSMNGNSYVDVFEERISIGEVLGDAENYSTVVNAVEPILRNLPSKYLCIISKTDIISAEVLANKVKYSAPVTYQEANCYSKEPMIDAAPTVNPNLARTISPDIIGISVYKQLKLYSNTGFNLYNASLGDLFLSEQPPELFLFGRQVSLSIENILRILVFVGIFFGIIFAAAYIYLEPAVSANNKKISEIEDEISRIKEFLKENNDISADLFDEGLEIREGLSQNKAIFTYYTIVGTEIPKKLWLTHLKLSDTVTIEGQADNLESVYGFFRSIKDYNPDSGIKLQKLGLASSTSKFSNPEDISSFDSASLLTSIDADYYEFKISNEPEVSLKNLKDDLTKGKGKDNKAPGKLPELENIND